MEYLINNSLIINLIYRGLVFLYNNFKESATYALLKFIGEKIKVFFSYSLIWNYLSSPDPLDRVWTNSFFYRLLDRLMNFPLHILRKIYIRYEKAFEASYGFKFIRWLLMDFHSVLGFSLLLIFIIPDHKWYNLYGVVLVLGLFVLFFIRNLISLDRKIDLKDLDFTLIIFVFMMAISSLGSLFPKESINYLIYYIISLLMVLIIVNTVDSSKDINRIVELLVFTSFLTALYGIYQWKIVGIEVNPSLTDISINQGMSGRVFSTLGNPNIYGEFLVLTLPFFASLFLNARSWWKKSLYLILLMPVILILFLTGSRSAWVSFAFSAFVFVFFTNRKLLPFMILAGVLAIPLLPQSIYRRILTIFNPNDSSMKYRKQILEPALPMLRDYWLGGVGLGNQSFNTIYKRYKSFRLKTVAHTHQLYLQIWLETGILGILSFFWLLFRFFKKSFNLILAKKNPEVTNILIGCISGIAGLLLMGFADHVWFYNRILLLFWVIIGLGYASIKLLKED